jgi:hypothetical protein
MERIMVPDTNQKLPTLQNLDEQTQKDLSAILYAINLVRQATGFGSVEIVLRNGQIVDMKANHDIKPKFLNIT